MQRSPRLPHRSYGDDRWAARPFLACGVRFAIVAIPILASLAATAGARTIVPVPATALARVVWVAGMLTLAVLVVMVADRVVRRAMPLATLLRMAMLFPDRAPSRFRLARRAGSTRELRKLADEALADGAAERSAAQAAASVLALVTALSAHDRRTRGHAERVRIFTDMLAEEFRLPEDDRYRLRWAALLHDIGKLTVHAGLLNKPGKLDDREWDAVRAHPVEGARIAEPLMVWLGSWGRTIVEHHERYDGTGYPFGRSGDAISVGARLVSVADAYDTMTAARSYKRPIATRVAREELARCAGSQFDPVMVRAFLSISVPRLVWVSGPASFVLHLPYLWRLQRAGEQALGVASQAAAAGAVVAAAAVVIGGPLGGVVPRHPATPPSAGHAGAAQLSASAPTVGHGMTQPGAASLGGKPGGRDPSPAPGPSPTPEPTEGPSGGVLGIQLPLRLPTDLPLPIPTELPLPLPTPTKLPLSLPTKLPLALPHTGDDGEN
jgi:putative nucleotidyltransferase with HDIG domain